MTTEKLPPIHPGKILREEFLEPLHITPLQLAQELKIPTSRITPVLQETQPLTAELALRLGRYFDLSPMFWLNLQNHYDLDVTEDALANRLWQALIEREWSTPAHQDPTSC
jgi:addiction module HigA family antidote